MIRHLEERDYDPIISVIDEWWCGRKMSHLLPRIFFIHFRPTSFAVEESGTVIGFLAGFISQTNPAEAYIHFVGVHPEHRRRGLGRRLYGQFFDTVRGRDCHMVRCITSPVNKDSIAFHTRMGFHIEHVAGDYDGVPCALNYELNGEHRVLFVRELS
jgi:ribosomal protein S18 acetylase RimI-like enzyme